MRNSGVGQATEAVAGAEVAGDQMGEAVGAESPTSSEMAEQLRELQEHAPEVERLYQEIQQLLNIAAKEQQAAGGATGNRKQWAMQQQQRTTAGGITGDKDTASSSTRILWTAARSEGGRGHCRWQQAPSHAATSNELRHSGRQ